MSTNTRQDQTKLGNLQGRYWMLTIPADAWSPPQEASQLPRDVAYIRGQKEVGNSETSYIHWQILVVSAKLRGNTLKRLFCRSAHVELSRSEAADKYVWKDDTAIEGTRFEVGQKPFKRNCKTDWDGAKEKAKAGLIDQVPSDVYIKFYRTLKMIAMDNMEKQPDLNDCAGIWIYGPPGTGKSHYARQHYGNSLYLKAQNKWWDGYQNESNVLLDDFDCKALGHYLKIWADKYCFMAECKGSSIQIRPKHFIITSNYSIDELFGEDPVLAAAIKRRFYVIHMPMRMY